MTREEVIRLAKEAGIGTAFYGKGYEPLIEQIWGGPMRTNELARFAELVAAAEREACAVVCMQQCSVIENRMSLSVVPQQSAQEEIADVEKVGKVTKVENGKLPTLYRWVGP